MSEEKSSTSTDTTKPASDKPAGDSSDSSTGDSGGGDSGGGDSGGGDSGGGKKKASPARPTSYFSNVRSDEYRSGWEDIFGGGKSKTGKQARASKAAANGPITIELGNGDFDDALLEGLETALRRKAKKDKIKLGRKSKTRQFNWRLTCEITG